MANHASIEVEDVMHYECDEFRILGIADVSREGVGSRGGVSRER